MSKVTNTSIQLNGLDMTYFSSEHEYVIKCKRNLYTYELASVFVVNQVYKEFRNSIIDIFPLKMDLSKVRLVVSVNVNHQLHLMSLASSKLLF